jgi:hypothetical protein
LPHLKAKFSCLVLCMAALGLSPAHAMVYTYDVDEVLSSTSKVAGTITTDALGSIDAADITSWDLKVTVGTHNATIESGTGSTVIITGGNLTATGSSLDFSNTAGVHSIDFVDFPAKSFFDIFVELDIPHVGDLGQSSWDAHNHLSGSADTPGDLVIAQTPLPAALPLFAVGLGAIGFLGRRRKRNGAAATAGA